MKPWAFVVLACALGAGCKRTPTHVHVDAAHTTKGAGLLAIDGARLDLDRGGAYDKVCKTLGPMGKGQSGCVDHHFYVFPIVPAASADGGTTTVTAWGSCQYNQITSLDACRARLAKEGLGLQGPVMIRVGDREAPLASENGWEQAIDDAKKKYGLETPRNSPVLTLDADVPVPR